jgi:formylglycine-generating enzyme required for sulfatase activity
MGSLHGLPFAPEDPVHQVTFASSFLMGKFPITQEQYGAIMGSNPSQFTEYATAPVETVSWQDAKLFCEKLSAILGQHARLPSEAEWEYVCRAGTSTEYYFGSAWMTHQDRQDRRSVRGAAWNMDAFRCRSSYRSYAWKDTATARLGFRVVVAAV